MERIIDGVLYESKIIPDSWDVRVFEVNGHREVSARNAVIWEEKGFCPPNPHYRHGDGYKGEPTLANLAKWAAQDASDAEDRRLKSLKKSAGRAMTMCRRVIKAEGFNELLTLTYRLNQTDRELCKKHFKEWVRRMKRALGDFRFCASFEQQERGAMHVHVATHKLPQHAQYKGFKVKAWEVGTRIWRDIVGNIELVGPMLPGVDRSVQTGGLCFVGGKPKNAKSRRKNMSIGKMASYVSKYILKDYELSPEEKNRYSRSDGTVVPKSVVTRLVGCSLIDCVSLAFTCADGDVVISHRIGRDGDSYWLVTEPQT